MIEGNVCTNTSAYYYGGWGYYLDEGSSNVTVRGNLAFDLKTAGFTQHCEHAQTCLIAIAIKFTILNWGGVGWAHHNGWGSCFPVIQI